MWLEKVINKLPTRRCEEISYPIIQRIARTGKENLSSAQDLLFVGIFYILKILLCVGLIGDCAESDPLFLSCTVKLITSYVTLEYA